MSALKDITGQQFGRLTAVKRVASVNGKSLWLCRCDCGGEKNVRLSDLTGEKIKSCGCLHKETAAAIGKTLATHGMSGSRIWTIWCGMKRRCKANPHYTNVSVCKDWERFESFYEWALENGYKEDLTLDRKDTRGDYTPNNCRWVTYKEQENNRTNNVQLTVFGETKTIARWSDATGIGEATIAYRIKAGWPEKDLFMPTNLGNAKIRRENNL